MKIFISWSGIPSRELAEALRWWLPKVIQQIEPFVSAKDIHRGTSWANTIMSELEATNFGIVCVTPDNLDSRWLHYEAGALKKTVESRVCPVLLGVEKSQVGSPLSQLQLTGVTEDDMLELVRSINAQLEAPLASESLKETVEIWWPRLRDRIATIKFVSEEVRNGPKPSEPEQPASSENEILLKVLEGIEKISRRISRIEARTQDARGLNSASGKIADHRTSAERWAKIDQGLLDDLMQQMKVVSNGPVEHSIEANTLILTADHIVQALPESSQTILDLISSLLDLDLVLQERRGPVTHYFSA